MAVGISVGVVSGVPVGVGEGVGDSVGVSVGESVGVPVGSSVGVAVVAGVLVGSSDCITVALITGLRLWLLLIAAGSAVMSIITWVVSPSTISNLTIMSILSEGTFRGTSVSGLSENTAAASETCKRIFE